METSMEPFVLVEPGAKVTEQFINFYSNYIIFKAGVSTVLLGTYLTSAKSCIWTAHELAINAVQFKLGNKTSSIPTLYMTIVLKYQDIKRIDYYVGEQTLKMFVMIGKSTMDRMRADLDIKDTEKTIKFFYESKELSERYLTVFFNLTDKSHHFIEWLKRCLAKKDPNIFLNRINFDLSIGAVLKSEFIDLKKELRRTKALVREAKDEIKDWEQDYNFLTEDYNYLYENGHTYDELADEEIGGEDIDNNNNDIEMKESSAKG